MLVYVVEEAVGGMVSCVSCVFTRVVEDAGAVVKGHPVVGGGVDGFLAVVIVQLQVSLLLQHHVTTGNRCQGNQQQDRSTVHVFCQENQVMI